MAEQHPYPGIWERLQRLVQADPTRGEQRLAGAVQHAQAEPDAVFEAHLDGLDCGRQVCGTCGRPTCCHEAGALIDIYRASPSHSAREYRCVKCSVIFTVEMP